MGKSKKKKPIKRPHVLPKDWLLALSDKLHMQNPSKAIVFNTIKDVFCKGYTIGYTRRREDSNYFRIKQEKRIKDDFNRIKDQIDDNIHEKSNQCQ